MIIGTEPILICRMLLGANVNFYKPIPDNTTRALNWIRDLVEGERLPRDGRLPTERELTEQIGCGRRTVRRALEALELEGLIWRRQGKGTFSGQPPDPTGKLAAQIAEEVDPLAAMEARMAIEPMLAALCARRATSDDVERLRQLMVRTNAATDADSAELWDGAFHRMIARVAGNRLLLTAFALLDEVRMVEMWLDVRLKARTPENKQIYDDQHQRILLAIEARDQKAAKAAMEIHLESLTVNLKRSLEAQQ